MKKLLLLGGSAQQIIAIETAKEMGLFTVLCDYLPDNPGQKYADKFYLVSTTDKDAVLKVAAEEKVDGILAYASEPAAPAAAYAAQKLGLPGNPYTSVETLCNKDRFRAFLKDAGLNAPAAKGYDSESAITMDAELFDFPVIVKPVDSSGSKGVSVLNNPEGLEHAVQSAFSCSRVHRIIVEHYIQKKHTYLIGGDIFVINGQIVLWGLLNCHRDLNANPLVPAGKSFPLKIKQSDIENVKHTLSALVEKLNFQNGPMNVELVIDENNRVWPVDIGPRSGGNRIPDLLGDIFGVNIAKMSIDAAMGNPVSCETEQAEGFYATYNLHSCKNGIYRGTVFSSEIEKYIYRKCIYKESGDTVEFFDNASKCLGIIFMKFPDEHCMDTILGNIHLHIQIILE